MGVIARYRLKKDLPNLKAGVVFEHRKFDNNHPDRGNIGCGSMVLGWINGNCQDGWCGDSYVFPGQLSKNTEWFELIYDSNHDGLIDELKTLLDKYTKK